MRRAGKPVSGFAGNAVPAECCENACSKVTAMTPDRVEVVSFSCVASMGKEIPKQELHSSACIGRCFGEMMGTVPGVCPADGERVVGNSHARLEIIFYQKGVAVERVCLHESRCLERLRARRCSEVGITHPAFKGRDERPILTSDDRFQVALRNAAEEPYASMYGNGCGGRRSAPMQPR